MEHAESSPRMRPTGKALIKERLQRYPKLWARYMEEKYKILRMFNLRWISYDLKNIYRYMHWSSNKNNYRTLSTELLFQYHKLEKGMVMPGKPRIFGLDAVHACICLLERWQMAGFDNCDPVFLGGIETLVSYHGKITKHKLDPDDRITSIVQQTLNNIRLRDSELQTPQPLIDQNACTPVPSKEAFYSLCRRRRSVRSFTPENVDSLLIRWAISTAQLSPSVCNRQPWHVYILDQGSKRDQLLDMQNGNRGFGHLAPHIAVLTSDEQCFYDATERHEQFVDGGLFAMTLLLALSSAGLGSCCLNWCVSPSTDMAAQKLLNIPLSRRIVMLVAFGYPAENCEVPKSPRRAIDDVLSFVQ